MKYLSKITLAFALASASLLAVSCVEEMPAVNEEIVLTRCLTPTDLKLVDEGQTLSFSWTKTRGADSFVVEIYDNEAMTGTPVKTIEVSAEQTLPVTAYLDPDVTYWSRVKAVDSTGKMEDSNWASFRKVEVVPIKSALDPVLVERAASSITISWTSDPEVDHIRITPALDGSSEYTKVVLSKTEVSTGKAVVSGLSASTYYTLAVHFSSASRGKVTAWTLPDASGASVVVDTAQFKQLIRDGASKILVPYADTAFVIGNVVVSQPLTLIGQPSSEGVMPTVVGGFHLTAGATALRIESLKFDGKDYTYGHVITLDEAAAGLGVDIVNCEFTRYTKGFFYDNFPSAVNHLSLDGVYCYDFKASGGDFIDIRPAGTYGNIAVINSTFANGQRDFIRIDKATVQSFILDHCTLNNWCAAGTNNGIFYVRGTVTSFVCSNNLFLNEKGGEKNCLVRQTSYKVPSFSGNWFYNVGGSEDPFLKTVTETVATTEGGIVKDSPCVDTDALIFNLTDKKLIEKQIGDPRWIEPYVKVVEDLTQEVTVPVKTWELTNSKTFYKQAAEDMVRDGIRFYVKEKPVVFEADGFLLTDAAVLENGKPVDCGLGIKVAGPGSLVISTGTAGDGSALAVVNIDGKPVIGVPAGANNTKVVFDAVSSEQTIYVYGTGAVKITSLQWSDDVETGGSNILDVPVPVADLTSVNEGEDKTINISWDAVSKAGSYAVTLDGVSKGSVTETSYSLQTSTLAPGEHVIGIVAMPAAEDLVRQPSEAAEVKFTVVEVLKQVLVETVWDSLYFKACSAKFGTDAIRTDFVEKNLGYVNGTGSGFKFAKTELKTDGSIYRCQMAGSGTITDGKLTKCGMQIMVGGNGTLEIMATGSGDAARKLIVNGLEYDVPACKDAAGPLDAVKLSIPVTAAPGDVISWCSKSGGLNIYCVKWTPAAAELVDETAINVSWNADYSNLEIYPEQSYAEDVTIEKVTYYAAEGKTIKWTSKRMQFGGKPSYDTETYHGVTLPTGGARYATFKITKPGTIKVFFYSGGSSNTGRNASVVLETNVGGVKSAKTLYSKDAACSTSAADGLAKITVTKADLAGITEAAVVYLFSNNNTIQITQLGFEPAS